MFTIEQIKQAHAQVKSGADFPAYIQDLIKLGVKKYDTFVSDGHSIYFGENNFELQSIAKYTVKNIATKSDSEKFKNYLKIHQQGQTDYSTFCNHSAETGIEKWIVNTTDMTCAYFDMAGNTILVEKIAG